MQSTLLRATALVLLAVLVAAAPPAPARAGTLLVLSAPAESGRKLTELEAELAQRRVAFDTAAEEDLTQIANLAQYATIIVAINGAATSKASLDLLREQANAGARVVVFGGTVNSDFAVGMQPLLRNAGFTTWLRSSSPNVRFLDAATAKKHGGNGIDFVNQELNFYCLRVADPDALVLAENEDGFPVLLAKAVGSGVFVYFAYTGTDWLAAPSDLALLGSVVGLALAVSPAEAVWTPRHKTVVFQISSGTGENPPRVHMLFHDFLDVLKQTGVTYDKVSAADDFGGFALGSYQTVVALMDGGVPAASTFEQLARHAAERGARVLVVGGANADGYYEGMERLIKGNRTLSQGWKHADRTVYFRDPAAGAALPQVLEFETGAVAPYLYVAQDPEAQVAYWNSDGVAAVVRKPLGNGLAALIVAPMSFFGTNSTDRAHLLAVLQFVLGTQPPRALSESETGVAKTERAALLRKLQGEAELRAKTAAIARAAAEARFEAELEQKRAAEAQLKDDTAALKNARKQTTVAAPEGGGEAPGPPQDKLGGCAV